MQTPRQQLNADARTVLDLADHFESLKADAADLQERFNATGRGYFTPTEEEETHHLLVSYWQARSALLELVTSLYRQVDWAAGDRPELFLIGYAGALVLIDAAQFLKERFDSSKVVRRKLNEADPVFGIPAGAYDAVQKSLTGPQHVWQIFQARRYYQENQQELWAQANFGQGEALRAIIQRLDGEVSRVLGQFAPDRLLILGREFLKGIREDALGQAIYVVQEYASRFLSRVKTRPRHQSGIPEPAAQVTRRILRPGDVMITRTEFALTNYFLPGYWPHAALHLGTLDELREMGLPEETGLQSQWRRMLDSGSVDPHRVLEALKDGVWTRSLASPFGVDALVVLRPLIQPKEIAAALRRGLVHEGKAYDFDFDFTRSNKMVCTEVIYRTYEGIGGIQFQLTRRAGRLTLSAEDLLRLALRNQYFGLQMLYAPDFGSLPLVGKPAVEALRASLREEQGA